MRTHVLYCCCEACMGALDVLRPSGCPRQFKNPREKSRGFLFHPGPLSYLIPRQFRRRACWFRTNATKPMSFCCVRWLQKNRCGCSASEPLAGFRASPAAATTADRKCVSGSVATKLWFCVVRARRCTPFYRLSNYRVHHTAGIVN